MPKLRKTRDSVSMAVQKHDALRISVSLTVPNVATGPVLEDLLLSHSLYLFRFQTAVFAADCKLQQLTFN